MVVNTDKQIGQTIRWGQDGSLKLLKVDPKTQSFVVQVTDRISPGTKIEIHRGEGDPIRFTNAIGSNYKIRGSNWAKIGTEFPKSVVHDLKSLSQDPSAALDELTTKVLETRNIVLPTQTNGQNDPRYQAFRSLIGFLNKIKTITRSLNNCENRPEPRTAIKA